MNFSLTNFAVCAIIISALSGKATTYGRRLAHLRDCLGELRSFLYLMLSPGGHCLPCKHLEGRVMQMDLALILILILFIIIELKKKD